MFGLVKEEEVDLGTGLACGIRFLLWEVQASVLPLTLGLRHKPIRHQTGHLRCVAFLVRCFVQDVKNWAPIFVLI